MRQTYGRRERLKSRKLIEALFRSGAWLAEDPVKLVYLFTPLNAEGPAQAGVSVSKKVLKRAVDRNRVKRQMREAYRMNKTGLYEHLIKEESQCAMMFIYKGAADVDSSLIEKKICKLLQRLLKEHG